jgi:hypothetical protein
MNIMINLLILFSVVSCQGHPTAKTTALPSTFAVTSYRSLSKTGFQKDQLLSYEPRFPLYSNGLAKNRYIRLPSAIEAKNLDTWEYPEGTKIWKEFVGSRGEVIETRYMEKVAGNWNFGTFVTVDGSSDPTLWRGQDSSLSIPTPGHTIPSYGECLTCHDQSGPEGLAKEPVLGFSSFQLSRKFLEELVASETLNGFTMPWQRHRTFATTTLERDVIGYLHSNCGHCHNERRPDTVPGIGNPTFHLNYNLESHQSRAQTNVIKQIGGKVASIDVGIPGLSNDVKLILPKHAALSMIYLRMHKVTHTQRMPLLGINIADETFIKTKLEPWISQLN